MREGEDGMMPELEISEEGHGLLAPPTSLPLLRPSPSSSSSRQHLSVTILELSSSPGTAGYGLDSDSYLSNASPGGVVMTPCGATPERRESNNNSDTFGPGVDETMSGGVAYSMEELVQAATWAVSYDNEREYARRFRREFKKAAPDPKTITLWKKELLESGLDPRTLLQERTNWETRYLMKEHRRAGKATFQGQVYNFLERPTGWKCFMYHISV